MKINRHNYEKFFLLYIDNELQPEQRNEVENFAAQNSYLADELKMLQMSVLPHADVTFVDKKILLKKEDGISLTNHEEFFLLYVDNELNKQQAAEVEIFVLQHPELQQNFTLLKKSALEPQRIIFENKQLLHRTEKEKRLVPLMWMRMSVAAALIACIAMAWIFSQNQLKNITKPLAATDKVANIPTDKIKVPASVTNPTIDTLQSKPAKNYLVQKIEKNTIFQKDMILPKPLYEQVVAVKKQVEETETKNKETQLIIPRQVALNVPEVKEVLPQMAYETKENDNEASKKDELIKQAITQTVNGEPGLASNAVYREVDTNDEDKNLYIGSASFNKNKIRGLFKKAARLLGNSNEEK